MLYAFRYTYDSAGNVLEYVATLQGVVTTTTYGYDAANQLSTATQGSTVWHYAYDGNGSLIQSSPGEGVSNGAKRYTYSVAGYLTKVESYTNGWEPQAEMVYDGLGNRLAMTAYTDGQSVTTHYTLDKGQTLLAVAGEKATAYLYGLGMIGEQTDAWSYSLPDGSNTPRQLLDGTGVVTLSAAYTPWGDTLEVNGQGNLTSGYFGGMLDAATGLIYVGGGQYYDPATGRFLTRGVNPDQGNPYVPWRSDPVGVMFVPLALLGMVYGGKKKRGKWDQWVILLVLCGAVGMSLSACGTQPTTVSTPTATATITPMPNQTLQVEAIATTVPGTPTATFTLTPTLAPDQSCGSPGTPTPEKIEESYKQLAEYAKNNPIYGSSQELAEIQSHITSLVNSASAHSLNTNQLAYVLATAQHETLGWTNFVEMCGDEQIPCDPNDNHNFFNLKYNGINGNASVGDDGWAFRGRGYIMLTFKDNYKKVGENIGFPLDAGEGYAEYAYCSRLDMCSFGASTYAAEIAIVGMKEGLARGTKLEEFDHGNDFDFEGARDIIHANDNARQRIADLGSGYAELLSARCQLGGLPGGVICRCYPVE